MRKIKPDLQAQPIGAVIEDYYDRHVGLGARPMVFIVNKRLKGDYYQIACYPGKTHQLSERYSEKSIWYGRL